MASAAASDRPRVGVLAIQGDFEAHARALERAGALPTLVRTRRHLEGVAALVFPGGESTTIMRGIAREGLAEPLRQLIAGGLPTLATCAGMIVLDRAHLGVLDLRCRRNAFGRQIASFECDLELSGLPGGPVRAVFIRAPWVEEAGPSVEILAEVNGHPVAVREGAVTALAFHPELTDDLRFHEQLVAQASRRSPQVGPRQEVNTQ
ncbi:pyridoxal 5'-phosphate synthase glutaminase subunit PdxT [Thermoleophilum album]|uniref:pyridoxal 5'-phosphate synthase glutaminase subunit PdxT n=1 Tax=Thermoleophilum album TaxID=29539 RepID=UPI000B87183C|nr:pyridoxal 5'-phosphate synthase glutaminase subunit PdxT [Thermoleophilum album]